ncbi:MAG: hypothetical protein P1T08_12895 [Acidimicrobiia bacterium]|nr:hypothetical protein [Acidimicrobiia bacterium]
MADMGMKKLHDPWVVQRAEFSLAVASLQLAVADSLPDWLFKLTAFLEGCAVARRMEAFETIKEWEQFKLQAGEVSDE